MTSVLFGFDYGNYQTEKNKNREKQDECLNCHKEMEKMPADFSKEDVHRKLTCASCHGGDPNSSDISEAMDPSKGFIGVPTKKEIPEFCGRCHSNIEIMRVYQPRIATDQVKQYFTSMHGKELLKGNLDVADCSSCHSSHNILPVKDPRANVYKFNVPKTCNKCHGDSKLMKKYRLPHNQFEEYSKSVHGLAVFEKKDRSAPVCTDCHGNHGAMPPGVNSIAHVCGTCHAGNMELFSASKMAQVSDAQKFHSCEQCHGNHVIQKPDDSMLGIEKNSKCISCHKAGDKGFETAQKLKDFISQLKNNYELAKSKNRQVKQLGMNDVEIGFALQDARQSIIQIKTAIHSFDLINMKNKMDEGLGISNKAIKLADEQIDEYYTRRNGFAAATLIFLVFAIALYLKIKEKQKNRSL